MIVDTLVVRGLWLISQHLAVLEEAGLVETRRGGRYKFHDLKTEPLKQIDDRWLKPRNQEDL